MVQICSIWCIYKGSRSPRHILSSSGLFLHNPDIFRIIQKLSRLSRYIFRSSRLFLEYPDTFFRFSGHFLHHLETFQFILTLFRSSGNFPVHPDTLHIIWIFCNAKYPEILLAIMNLSQKLSGFAKTFRSALLTR